MQTVLLNGTGKDNDDDDDDDDYDDDDDDELLLLKSFIAASGCQKPATSND